MRRLPFPLVALLGFGAMTMPLFSQDVIFKNARTESSLVELYSSEGCSSCPPAEAWMTKLKSAPGLWTDLFPVVFHVDYWDNLGWPDRFARADYTQRQRDYAERLGQQSVYTPEFVVNGAEWRRGIFGGSKPPDSGTKKSGELSVAVRDGKISADYKQEVSVPGQALTLNVAVLGMGAMTDVKRGENSGRKLEHDFVVLNFSSTPMIAKEHLYQAGQQEMKSSTSDAPGAVVVWVSAADGTILQIAGGPL